MTQPTEGPNVPGVTHRDVTVNGIRLHYVRAGEETAEPGEFESFITPERYTEMGAAEQFVLTVNERGFGKRSSSFEFRVTRRGGQGIRATDVSRLDEIGPLVAAFPVEPSDQIMLVSDGGTLIRVPVDGIRFASRTSKGVRIFNTAPGERVVSVEHIPDPGEAEPGETGPDEDGSGENGPPGGGPDGNGPVGTENDGAPSAS